MKITLQHNTPSADVVFENVHEVIFQPEMVWLYFKPLEPDQSENDRAPDVVIKEQKTTGRHYWNYRGTWYPQFHIADPIEAVQLRLIG